MPEHQPVVNALLERYGRTFASELGIDLRRNTPSPLFRLLCLSMLTSAPIQGQVAMNAAKALGAAGWTTAEKLRDSTWRERVRTLNEAGYARMDEKTATRIVEMSDMLLSDYRGDLRHLRARADGSVNAARDALKAFKGIGDVGAGIFLREVQAAWPELYPYADKASLKAAKRLGLPDSSDGLAELVDRNRFTELLAALVRVRMAGDFRAVQVP